MKKVYYSWFKISSLMHNVIRGLHNDAWRPDYVVGIVRGGNYPAGLYSHYTGVPMYTLKVQLKASAGENTEDDVESNAWMSEDAFNGKKILIFDDINDSGKTLQWIKSDWRASTHPADPKWQNDMIFGNNVKVACLIEITVSDFEVDYIGDIVNKIDDPQWIVFPWEEWWNLPTF